MYRMFNSLHGSVYPHMRCDVNSVTQSHTVCMSLLLYRFVLQLPPTVTEDQQSAQANTEKKDPSHHTPPVDIQRTKQE